MIELAKSKNCLYLVGSASAIEMTTPFYAFKYLMQQLLLFLNTQQETDKSKRNQLENYLRDVVGKKWLQFAPLLNDVIPSLEIPENNQTSKFTPEQRKHHLSNLLASILLEQSAKSPLLLILENLQWMDEVSLSLIETILSFLQTKPILLLITTRPTARQVKVCEDILNTARQIGGNENCILLPPLSDKSIVALAYTYGGIFKGSPLISSILIEMAEGNPLFAQSIMDDLLQKEIVTNNNNILQIKGELSSYTELPDNIQAIINALIDQLDPTLQMVLKVASAIGKRFSVKLLKRIFPIRKKVSNMESYCELLARLGFIEKCQSNVSEVLENKAKAKLESESQSKRLTAFPGINLHLEEDLDSSFAFVRSSLYKTLYSRLLFEQRKNLAFEIAEFYESKDTSNPSNICKIALHLTNGVLASKQADSSLVKKTLSYTQKAVSLCLQLKKGKAFSFCERALKLIHSLPQECLTLEELNPLKEEFERILSSKTVK